MRFLAFIGAFALVSTAAIAGSPDAAVIDPEVISAAAIESSADDNWVGVLLTFITIVMIGIGN